MTTISAVISMMPPCVAAVRLLDLLSFLFISIGINICRIERSVFFVLSGTIALLGLLWRSRRCSSPNDCRRWRRLLLPLVRVFPVDERLRDRRSIPGGRAPPRPTICFRIIASHISSLSMVPVEVDYKDCIILFHPAMFRDFV